MGGLLISGPTQMAGPRPLSKRAATTRSTLEAKSANSGKLNRMKVFQTGVVAGAKFSQEPTRRPPVIAKFSIIIKSNLLCPPPNCV